MKKFAIGLVAGFVLAGLVLVVLVLSLARLGESPPKVADGSTLVLNLGGSIPERPPMRLPLPLLESHAPATLQELWAALDRAAADDRIKALAVFPQGLDAGWGKLQEIREGLIRFRKSGKPVFVYLRTPGMREYYLATASDQVFLAPGDFLDVKGLRVEALYFKDTLNKLGVEFEIEHAGKYKDAGDMLTRRSMSPETREVLDSILDELYAHVLRTIAERRGRTPGEIRALMDQGPFLAREARANGLVEDLLFEDQFYERLAKALGQDEVRKVSHMLYLRTPDLKAASARNRVALVVASGEILSGSGGEGFGDDGILWSRRFIRTLRQVRDDRSVKGVILRIDSPGGDAIASDEILREVHLLRAKKPLVVSMSDVAASGGYYIAMTGDPVVAYPNTVTGSIGVVYGKANLKGLYEKLGIGKEVLTRGRFAAIDSDAQPLDAAGRAKLRAGVESVYESFLQVVAKGRRKTAEEVTAVAEGRVWLGSQAQRNGLVDHLGGLDRAVALAKEKAGLPADERVWLVTYPQRQSLIDYLMDQSDLFQLEARLSRLAPGFNLRLWTGGQPLRLMPFRLEFR